MHGLHINSITVKEHLPVASEHLDIVSRTHRARWDTYGDHGHHGGHRGYLGSAPLINHDSFRAYKLDRFPPPCS